MSKMMQIKKPSVLPWYGAAAVWLVMGIAAPLYRLPVLLGTAAVSALVFVGAKKICPPRVQQVEVGFHTGVDDVDQMLASMESNLDALHTLNDHLSDVQLSAAMDRMEKAGRGILEVVEQTPEKGKTARRFANYYLPDAVQVLRQYANLARQGVRGENAAAVKAEVEQNAARIATAFENQLDALYAAESMDLSADLEVLQSLMKGQGL